MQTAGGGSVSFSVMPASLSSPKRGAGIQGQCFDWIPAFAGMGASDGKLAHYHTAEA